MPPTNAAVSSAAAIPREPPTAEALQDLLKRVSAASPASAPHLSLLPADILLLVASFTAELPARVRSLGFLILAQLAQGCDNAKLDKALGEVFTPVLDESLLQTKEADLERTLTFLSALLQAAPRAGVAVLARSGFLDGLWDITDLKFSSPRVPLALADVLSQAANTKQGRAALAASSDSSKTWLPWLEGQTAEGKGKKKPSPALRATAAVALAKLSRAPAAEPDSPEELMARAEGGPEGGAKADEGESESVKSKRDIVLASMLRDLIISLELPKTATDRNPPAPATISAIEGLAFTSLRGPIKELLAGSPVFLKKLFGLVPPPPTARSFTDPLPSGPALAPSLVLSPSLAYGVVSIICNLVAYLPSLTAEQAQLDQLRRMTTSAKTQSSAGMKPGAAQEDPLDDPVHVHARVLRLLKAGVVGVLVSLARTESQTVRDLVGRTLLFLVERQEDRGVIVQQGGVRALLTLVNTAMASPAADSKSSTVDSLPAVPEASLAAFQALAKLTITTNPTTLFGPSPSASLDALRPLSLLLLHENSSLLQQFEALMSLTNLASLGPELADRLAKSYAGATLRKTEQLLLEDHPLVRRAAVELICNLLASDVVFEAFSGEPSEDEKGNSTSNEVAAAGRLHLLLALATVDDLQTQLASSACLATLAEGSRTACRLLLAHRSGGERWVCPLSPLFSPSPDDDP